MRLMYRTTPCTPVQFLSAVAACSGASEADTFRTLSDLMSLLRWPQSMPPGTKRLLSDDIDRITYGVCKLELD